METPSSMGTEPKIIQQYSTAPHGPLMLKQDTFDSPRPPASSENVSHTVLANPEDIIWGVTGSPIFFAVCVFLESFESSFGERYTVTVLDLSRWSSKPNKEASSLPSETHSATSPPNEHRNLYLSPLKETDQLIFHRRPWRTCAISWSSRNFHPNLMLGRWTETTRSPLSQGSNRPYQPHLGPEFGGEFRQQSGRLTTLVRLVLKMWTPCPKCKRVCIYTYMYI